MAEVRKISTRLEIDGEAAYKKSLNEIYSNLKLIGSELKLNTQEYGKNAESIKGNRERAGILSKEIEQQKELIASLTQAVEDSSNAYGDTNRKTDEYRRKLMNAQAALERMEEEQKKAKNASNVFRVALSHLPSALDTVKKGMQATYSMLKSLASGFTKVAKSIAQTSQKIINTTSQVVKRATTIATGVGSALAGIGLTYNSQMEDYTTNFRVMLGSQEKAVKKVDELKKMAASTPFGMADLSNATQTLLAFNVDSEKTTSILRSLGDISLGNADKMQSLANAFGKANATGKVTGEVVQSMTDAGFNPLLVISQKTGESMAALQKRMSDGKVSVAELESALASATGKGGQFYQGMEQASKTMSGMISTLKDNAMAFAGQIFEPLFDAITGTLLPGAIDAVNQFSEAFSSGGLTGLLNVAAAMMDQMAATIAAKGPEMVSSAMSMAGQIVAAFAQSAPGFASAAGGLLQAFIGGIRGMMPAILEAVAQLAPTIVSAIVAYKGDMLNIGVQFIAAFVSGLASNLQGITKQTSESINAIISTITSLMPGVIQSGVDIIVAMLKGIQNSRSNIVNGITDTLSALIDTVSNNLDSILSSGVDILIALAEGIVNAIPTLVANIPKIMQAIVSTLLSRLPDILNIGTNIVKGLWQGIQSMIGWLWSKLTGWVGDIVDKIKSLFGIRSPSRVFRQQIGQNLGKGVALGIMDEEAAVANAMRNLMPDMEPIRASVQSAGYNVNRGVPSTSSTADTTPDTDAPRDAGGQIIVLQIDGREFARVTTPYIDRQQAKNWSRDMAVGIA